MKKIILWALCCMVFNLTQAQQSYEKAYKKAQAFTHTNADSAMVWAEKCLKFAKTKGQRYGAHYLRGFNAYKIGMHGQAIYDYAQSRGFASDQTAYFRINNNLADAYLKAGKPIKATKLNRQSIEYNECNQQWENLSYSYEVKSNILRKQKDKMALELLRKALYLRKTYAPRQIGYVYERMAIAFAAFGISDSAVKYQRLAVKHYPIKSPNKIAILKTQLAKNLIQNKQSNKALAYLEKAQVLKKTSMAKFFWLHTYGLYFMQQNNGIRARQMFVRCEDLYKHMLAKASDVVTQRTINECGKELYQDFKQLKDLKAMEHELYEAKLHAIKTSLASDELNIKQRDKLAEKDRQLRELKKVKADSLAKSAVETDTPQPQKQAVPKIKKVEAQHYPSLYWLLLSLGAAGLTILAGLRGFKIHRTTKVEKQKLTKGEYEALMTEAFLVSLNLGKNDEERPVVYKDKILQMRSIAGDNFRGMSYGKISAQTIVPKSGLKEFCDALLTDDQKSRYKSFTEYKKAFKAKWEKTSGFKIRPFFFPL